MKLKNALLIPLAVGLVVYGGVKGYIYFKVKQQMDNLATMVSPFVELTYGGISSSLAGEIGVEAIRVAPRGATEGIDVASANLRGDGIGFLLDLLRGVRMDAPPQQLNLSLRGVRMPVNEQFFNQVNPGLGALRPKPCTLGGIMQHASLEAAGFKQLTANAAMGYRLDRAGEEMSLRFSYDLEGIEQSRIEIDLDNVSTPGALAMGAMPALARMSMSYTPEAGYISKVVNHCAAQAGQEPALFIDGLFGQDDAYYAKNLGFIPGQGIKGALKQMLLQPGELLLTAMPDTSLNPMMLAAYKPKDMITMLNLGLSVNDQPVGDMSFEIPDLSRIAARFSQSGGSESGNKRPIKKRRVVPKPVYVETPLSELRRHVGRDVRLYTKDKENKRKPKQGVLIAMNGNMLDVEQRLYGGRMTVHIPLDVIEHAEVLLRPATPE